MAVRRLPVIQEPTGEDAEAAARPAWQWVVIGSGLLVTMWAPLAALVGSLARGFPEWGAAVATALVVVSLAVASVGSSYLVSRFGRRASLRHAIFGGVLGGAELWLIGWLGAAFGSAAVALGALLVLSAVTAAFSALGAGLARRGKVRS